MKFVYDGFNLIAELDGVSNNATRSFVWGLDESGTTQGAGGVGGLLMIIDGTSKYLTAYDGSGNLTGLFNEADGTVAAVYEYGPYGEPLRAEGPYAAKNPFRFSTKYTDSETGLVYFGLRYYEPTTGRFINRDPIGEAGGLNLYGFVGNDPINRVDFLGLTCADDPSGCEDGVDVGGVFDISDEILDNDPVQVGFEAAADRLIRQINGGIWEDITLEDLNDFETVHDINDAVGSDIIILDRGVLRIIFGAAIAVRSDADTPVHATPNDQGPDVKEYAPEIELIINIGSLNGRWTLQDVYKVLATKGQLGEEVAKYLRTIEIRSYEALNKRLVNRKTGDSKTVWTRRTIGYLTKDGVIFVREDLTLAQAIETLIHEYNHTYNPNDEVDARVIATQTMIELGLPIIHPHWIDKDGNVLRDVIENELPQSYEYKSIRIGERPEGGTLLQSFPGE